MKGRGVFHQAFLPKGFLEALEETPFTLNVDKARALLAQAGLADCYRCCGPLPWGRRRR